MNTTAAALEAQVTAATIRTWCRRGVVGAAKTAGRWVIDTASLARRITIGITIGKRKARMTDIPKPIVYSIETMVAIGGNRWQSGDKDRVYINNWAALAGLETDHYKSGSISGATWQGEPISNSQAYKLADTIDKVWFDAADGQIHGRFGYSQSRIADHNEVWAAVVAGIRAAIAAL